MQQLVPKILDQGRAANPGGNAVIEPAGHSISYDGLEALSNQVARSLVALGIKRNDRVILCLTKSINYVAAILGILKAGAIYVPVYEKSPIERALQIFLDCAPDACVTDQQALPLVAGVVEKLPAGPRIVTLDDPASPNTAMSLADILAQSTEPVDSKTRDTDIAYLLYTSGSTGKPKGVMVQHRNVMDYANWGRSYFSLGADDRILNTAPFYFDMSVFDIFCALGAGSSLCLATEKEYMFPGKLIEVAESYGTTVWKGVASLLTYLSRVNAIDSGRLGTLRTVIFAGEALPSKHLEHWMRTLPEIRFYNGYGPTEATGISICHSFSGTVTSESRIPLGLPCRNTEVLILQQEGRERCAPGEIGEICIQGAGVSAGYWNQPEMTQQRFILLEGTDQRPVRTFRTGDAGYVDSDGVFWMTGRLDDQVKVQGFRIELGEVVNALISHDDVSDAAVLLLPDRFGDNSLVAFLESQSDQIGALVRKHASEKLPAYMVPKTFHGLNELPRNERGKIDKMALESHHIAALQSRASSE